MSGRPKARAGQNPGHAEHAGFAPGQWMAHYLFNFSGDPKRVVALLEAKMWASAPVSDTGTHLPAAISP